MEYPSARAEAETIAFLEKWLPANASPICGNSICQDRRFLYSHMPKLEAYFHYRNLDVSTVKELAARWAPEILDGFKKSGAHLALADIQDSIAELQYYREHFIHSCIRPLARFSVLWPIDCKTKNISTYACGCLRRRGGET